MNIVPSLNYHPSLAPRTVRTAVIWGLGMPECGQTEAPPPFVASLLEQARIAGEGFLPPGRKAAVRNMLRYGSYKPSGRSKPSSEYLLAAALQDRFPLVNKAVDVNNAVSLQWGYPASIFDMDLCGTNLLLRRGTAEESYIFNSAGQSIELKDLICVCRAEGDRWLPCGNPVKDAMATKISDSTRNVIAVIYAPVTESLSELEGAAARFADLLRSHCEISKSAWFIP